MVNCNFMSMTKLESVQLKGVAILIMIWLHTFNHPLGDNYSPLFFLNGEALAYQMGKITRICISLYAFLGGYGLYLTYQKNQQMKSWRRIFLLYLNYWLVFVVFVGLGCLLSPDKYPGSFKEFLLNWIGVSTTYCKEWWFIFPYAILVLCAKWIIRAIQRSHYLITIGITGTCYLFANSVLHFFSQLHEYPLVADGLLIFSLLFSFSLGIMFAKHNIRMELPPPPMCKKMLNRRMVHNRLLKCCILIIALAGLIIVRMFIPTGIFNPVFMIAFLYIVYSLIKAAGESTVLSNLGRQNTKMWLIHPFFCYYLFSDFVYSFKYAPVIFIVMVVVSYSIAVLLDYFYKPLKNVFIH